MSTEELLRQVPIFATLSNNQIGELSQLVALRRFGKGDAMIREGDTSAELHTIVSGEISVTKKSPTGDVADP